MKVEDISVEYAKFAVFERPVCVWDTDIRIANLRYLDGLEPAFFDYEARIHSAAVAAAQGASESPAAHHPALALRIAYGMAVEAFFSLLGAVVQAPHCVFGWLTLYQPKEVRGLVHRLLAQEPIHALKPLRPATFENVAKVTLGPVFAENPSEAAALQRRFCDAWTMLAEDFVSRPSVDEYNSLKHSLRVGPGSLGVTISVRGGAVLESDSPYAVTYPSLAKLKSREGGHHYNVGRTHAALEPAGLVAATKVLAVSMHNLISYARMWSGEPGEKNTVLIPDDEILDTVLKRTAPVQRASYSNNVSVAEDEYFSAEDILSVYDDEA